MYRNVEMVKDGELELIELETSASDIYWKKGQDIALQSTLKIRSASTGQNVGDGRMRKGSWGLDHIEKHT